MTLIRCVTRWNNLLKNYEPVNFSCEINNPMISSKQRSNPARTRTATGSLTQGVQMLVSVLEKKEYVMRDQIFICACVFFFSLGVSLCVREKLYNHPCVTARSKSTPSKTPSKKVGKTPPQAKRGLKLASTCNDI